MAEEPEDDANAEDGGVLSPEELDISDEENVVELEEGRYVISPGNRPPRVPDDVEPSSEHRADFSHERDRSTELTDADVHEWLGRRLQAADSKYAFDVTATFEGRTAQNDLFSNDVVATFENLVVWYARHAGGDTPIEDVLGILLMESNLSIRFPEESLRAFVAAHGLDDEDSLETLFAVVREEGGVRFPPGDRR